MAKPSTKKKKPTTRRKARRVAPETAPQATAAEGTTDVDASPPETAAVGEPTAEAELVKLGPVTGRIEKTAIGIVHGILGAEMRERIGVLQWHASVKSVEERLRASDGRATPVIFAAGRAENEPPSLISGVEAVAAALNLGVEHVFVIIVAAEDVGAVQSYLVETARAKDPTEESEDDLYVRVLLDED